MQKCVKRVARLWTNQKQLCRKLLNSSEKCSQESLNVREVFVGSAFLTSTIPVKNELSWRCGAVRSDSSEHRLFVTCFHDRFGTYF